MKTIDSEPVERAIMDWASGEMNIAIASGALKALEILKSAPEVNHAKSPLEKKYKKAIRDLYKVRSCATCAHCDRCDPNADGNSLEFKTWVLCKRMTGKEKGIYKWRGYDEVSE